MSLEKQIQWPVYPKQFAPGSPAHFLWRWGLGLSVLVDDPKWKPDPNCDFAVLFPDKLTHKSIGEISLKIPDPIREIRDRLNMADEAMEKLSHDHTEEHVADCIGAVDRLRERILWAIELLVKNPSDVCKAPHSEPDGIESLDRGQSEASTPKRTVDATNRKQIGNSSQVSERKLPDHPDELQLWKSLYEQRKSGRKESKIARDLLPKTGIETLKRMRTKRDRDKTILDWRKDAQPKQSETDWKQ